MSRQKVLFTEFLKKIYPEDWGFFLSRFELFHEWLLEENSKINLISRKTDPDDIWTLHFLDSILPTTFIDFYSKNILDFGTGGGFPGIPLKILFPDSPMLFLDSKTKKIGSVKRCSEALNFSDTAFIAGRIEELKPSEIGTFDIITCRSVKILPRFRKPLFSFLNNYGRIILYKGREFEDAKEFDDYDIHDVLVPEMGERHIIEVFNTDF